MQKSDYDCDIQHLCPALEKVFFLSEATETTKKFQVRKSSFHQLKFMLFVLMSAIGFRHYNTMGILGYETFLFDEAFV